jgi:hypothetical protein
MVFSYGTGFLDADLSRHSGHVFNLDPHADFSRPGPPVKPAEAACPCVRQRTETFAQPGYIGTAKMEK